MTNVQVGRVGSNPLSVQKGNEVYHNIRDSDLFGTSRHAHQISPTKKPARAVPTELYGSEGALQV